MPTKPLTRFQKWVNREVRPLMRGRTFRAAVNRMTEEEIYENWAIVFFLEGVIKARKEALRDHILESTKTNGSPYTDKQGKFAGKVRDRFDHQVRAQKRTSTMPEEGPLRRLLENRAIDFEDAFTEVKKVVIDPSKVHDLVARGRLKEEDVDKTHKTNWALSVKVEPSMYKYLEILEDQEQ